MESKFCNPLPCCNFTCLNIIIIIIIILPQHHHHHSHHHHHHHSHYHQVQGINWLLFQWTQERSCLLADEMGLGKTMQALGFIETLRLFVIHFFH
jgi:hypothetical protein